MFGHVEVVARLLDAGADVNQPSVDAKTALMGAAMNGHFAVVELLLSRGADKSLRNAWDETAHYLAEARWRTWGRRREGRAVRGSDS